MSNNFDTSIPIQRTRSNVSLSTMLKNPFKSKEPTEGSIKRSSSIQKNQQLAPNVQAQQITKNPSIAIDVLQLTNTDDKNHEESQYSNKRFENDNVINRNIHSRKPSVSSMTDAGQEFLTPIDEQKNSSFWQILSFWQNASESERQLIVQDIDKLKKQSTSDEQNESTPSGAETNQELKILAQYDPDEIQQDGSFSMPAHELISTSENTQDQTRVWNWTNPVNRISNLFASSSSEVEQPNQSNNFIPNRVSQVMDMREIADYEALNPAGTRQSTYDNEEDDDNIETATRSSWWMPWKWGASGNIVGLKSDKHVAEESSETSTGIVEIDSEMQNLKKEVCNSIKCQSYGIPKPNTWAIMQTDGQEYGEVFITGTKSCKKPVHMKKLPKSMFEINELQIDTVQNGAIKEIDQVDSTFSVVLPDLKCNYRNSTYRTRTRIALSKVSIFKNLLEPETHLYYDSNNKRRKKNVVTKKVVVLAVHGFLPQKMVKNLIGESTGCSDLMKEKVIEELKRWGELKNVELKIDSVSMEGYGRIFERVNGCLSLLENWLSFITTCDYLVLVANSHSVPIAIHVLARLITAGHIDTIEKIGLISISGICMGPIAELEGKVSTRGSTGQENEMMSEIFDLEDPETLQSREIVRNFKILLRKNVKISFFSSINDCFAPLYSSLCLQLNHPNIYRAIFIDGKSHQPDFLVSLLSLILTVRNLNYKDHGLLLELSSFFENKAGEGGHSKILGDKYIYRLGIANMLNTSDLIFQQNVKEQMVNIKEFNVNTYHIPWCLRGFLEELEKLKKHFDVPQLVDQLFEEFKSWEPESKQYKELKYSIQAFENFKVENLGLK